ncbi:unnamed protein product [Medioppia subpectinata]|uniref:Uncharacterized protein n=1 Tax=Medioppia subpectinata TaxID=1979941 RepID=A0A7R9L2Q9_9ACAR|nr:unnamed protein product [Medioppia subpectinata]CAG2114477.1 unnamed protein product [Medioppia subpectinata]
MDFTFILNFNLILIQVFEIAFNSHICYAQEMDVYYETHKSLILENKLQDHDHSEEGVSLNSYALESMPLEIIILVEKTMALLVFDKTGKMLEKCQLFDLEKDQLKADMTASATGLPVIKSDFNTMMEAINKCRELSEKLSPVSSSEQISANITENSISLFSLWRGLIPGTKVSLEGINAN